ncbi:MAG: TonB family protein [Nitrospirota bacterium]|nr:TonB family protein [Nitrospirota bacterium]
MKEPSLPATAFFSFLLHLTFIFTALITIKNANHFTLPSAYIVSLVSTEVSGQPARGKEGTASQTEEPEQKMKLPAEPSKSKASEDAKQYSSDRIAAIEATRKAKRVVKLRNMVSIKGDDKQVKDTKELPPPKGNANEAATLDSYAERIGKEIRQRWAFPEAWGKNLEAVISVTIMSNGTVKINKVEKSSGNVLFDRSVLRAINKASPVSPPSHEMEIGLRFTP